MNTLLKHVEALSTTATATTIANGIKIELMSTVPIQVMSWGGVVTTAITTNPLQLRGNFRPTAGSASGEVSGSTASGVDTAGGQISLSTALGVAGRAFRHVVAQAAPTASNELVGLSGGLIILPGQSFTLEAFGTAPAAGAVAYMVEYVQIPFPPGTIATATVAGGGRGTLITL